MTRPTSDREAVEHFPGDLTIPDVEAARPTVRRDTLRSVLNDLRARRKRPCAFEMG